MFKKTTLTTVFLISLTSCASTPTPIDLERGYTVGEVSTAGINEELLSATYGSYTTLGAGRAFKNVFGSHGSRKSLRNRKGEKIGVGDRIYSKDYIIKDVIYNGKQGDTITLTYMEFRTDAKKKVSTTETTEHDLSTGNALVIENFTFEVIDATNERISAKLVEDRT